MSQKFKRRKFPIIHRGYQFHFLLRSLAYSLLLLMFLFYAFTLPELRVLNQELFGEDVRRFIESSLHDQLWSWCVVLALMLVSGMSSFRSILKIVGPAYRLRWAMDKVIDDDLDFEVRLREGDLLYDEADKFNQLIAHCSGRVSDTQRRLALLDEALQNARAGGDSSALDEVDKQLQSLRSDYLKVRVGGSSATSSAN